LAAEWTGVDKLNECIVDLLFHWTLDWNSKNNNNKKNKNKKKTQKKTFNVMHQLCWALGIHMQELALKKMF